MTDEQGRRRFHGAFTGGFSAGYYNSVGSAEGWAPSTFRSSRSDRGAAKPQSVEQFFDEDELEDLKRTNLQTSTTYDTFGDTAAEAARRAVLDESQSRPSAIPGLLPDEAVAPVAEGIGIQLLQRMGWRQGKGIGAAGPARQQDTSRSSSRWGTVAGVGPENTPLHLVKPKHDVYGLGYDPFRGAEEFRLAQQRREEAAYPNAHSSGRGKGGRSAAGGGRGGVIRQRGVAFGTGVMDEDDSFGILEDYVTHDDVESYEASAGLMDKEGMPLGRGPRVDKIGLGDRLALQGFAYEIQDQEESEGDDDGVLNRAAKRHRPLQITGPAAPLALQSAQHAKHKSLIPGFVLASGDAMQRPAFYPPPQIPADYIPIHRPAAAASKPPEGADGGGSSAPVPGAKFPVPPGPAVAPPHDPGLRQEIERLAFFVAKNGLSFESLAREQQTRAASSGTRGPMFLLGGEGAAFYAWKLATLRSLLAPKGNNAQPLLGPIGQRSAPLSAEDRGGILGEVPLKSSLIPGVPFSSSQAQHAQLQAKPAVPLARSLLNVAAEDRKKLAAAMGSTFIRAEAQEMGEQSQRSGGLEVQAGLRPGVARQLPGATPATPATTPSILGNFPPGSSPAAADIAQKPRGIITVQDLSRQVVLNTSAGGGGGPSAGITTAAAGAVVSQQQPFLPVRKSEEWRPEPLLCKRLDVPDPYRGRPKELQMSRFKTDHLVLPATAEAMTRAAAAVAPSLPDFLIPPAVRVAAEEAQAAAQLAAAMPPPPARPFLHMLKPSIEVPNQEIARATGTAAGGDVEETLDDATGAAEAFLSSVFGAPEGAEQTSGGAATAAEAKVLAEVATIEKPVDLFKAIFEDSSESESETEIADKVEGTAGGAGQGGIMAAVPAATQPGAQRTYDDALGRNLVPEKEKDKIFGFEKFKREGPYEDKIARDKYYDGREGGTKEKESREGAGGGLEALDPEVRSRVEAALQLLKEAKKLKKRKKERRPEKGR